MADGKTCRMNLRSDSDYRYISEQGRIYEGRLFPFESVPDLNGDGLPEEGIATTARASWEGDVGECEKMLIADSFYTTAEKRRIVEAMKAGANGAYLKRTYVVRLSQDLRPTIDIPPRFFGNDVMANYVVQEGSVEPSLQLELESGDKIAIGTRVKVDVKEALQHGELRIMIREHTIIVDGEGVGSSEKTTTRNATRGDLVAFGLTTDDPTDFVVVNMKLGHIGDDGKLFPGTTTLMVLPEGVEAILRTERSEALKGTHTWEGRPESDSKRTITTGALLIRATAQGLIEVDPVQFL